MSRHIPSSRWGAVSAAALALALTTVGPSAPASADPGQLETVRTQLAVLEIQSAAAAEQANGARSALAQSQERLALFSRQTTSSRIDLLAQTRALELMARELYVNGGFAGAVLSFSLDDPDQFLSSLDILSSAGAAQSSVVTQARTTALSLKNATEALAREQQRLADATRALGQQEAAAAAHLAQARALLASLEEAERQRLAAEAQAAREAAQREAAEILAQTQAARSAAGLPLDAAGLAAASSGDTAAVVSFALAQVGKPYVWGAPGPNAYDCSGLTRAAWAQAGVALTHYSGSQYAQTTPVATSDLQPGDLLYFYAISQHVGLYIGNGKFVHASNPRTGVVLASLDSYYRSNLVAASRPAVR